MPKTTAASQTAVTPTRVLRTQAGTGESTSQTSHAQSAAAGRSHPYASRSTQTNAMPQTEQATRSQPPKRDPNFEKVHANCTRFARSANERLRQLRLSLTEQQQTATDAAQQFETERARLQATIRQLGLENQKGLEQVRKTKEQVVSLQQQMVGLQQQLDGAHTDVRNRITRKEFEQTLSEIADSMTSMTKTVTARIGASQSVNVDPELPFAGEPQGSWAEQGEQLDLPDDFLASMDMTAAIDPQDVSHFDQYVAMP